MNNPISRLELMEALNSIAPVEIAESWDNCGFQVNLLDRKFSRILISLDITRQVIQEAVDNKCSLIICHHPLYFNGLKSVDNNDIIGEYTVKLVENHISVYAAHTCFDFAEGGNNDYVAGLLGLTNVKKFPGDVEELLGTYGRLEKSLSLRELAEHTCRALKLDPREIRFVGDGSRKIETVGICTGSGGDMVQAAARLGCDCFLTGDLKYHDALKFKEMGLAVIDAGHFGTEFNFVENIHQKLCAKLGLEAENSVFIKSRAQENPFDFL